MLVSDLGAGQSEHGHGFTGTRTGPDGHGYSLVQVRVGFFSNTGSGPFQTRTRANPVTGTVLSGNGGHERTGPGLTCPGISKPL